MPTAALEPRSADESAGTLVRFVPWAAQRLGIRLDQVDDDLFALTIAPDQRIAFDGQEQVKFTFEKARFTAANPEEGIELITPGGRILNWLVEQVRQLGNVTLGVPRHEPANVNELAGPLLAAYQVDDGGVHLAGCTLEPRPVLRLTYRLRLEGLEPRDDLLDIFTDLSGRSLAPEVVHELQLEDLVTIATFPRISRQELDALVQSAGQIGEERRHSAEATLAESLLVRKLDEVRQLEDYFTKTQLEITAQGSADLAKEEKAALDEQRKSLDEQKTRRLAAIEDRYSVHGRIELVAAILIWCRFAAGKFRFTIRGENLDLPFQNWAALLKAPTFVCPATGHATFHIGATDDGRIVAAEEIECCEITNEKLLRKELVRCAVTGKRVKAELTEICRVTGQPILKAQLASCPVCTLAVSPRALRGKQCKVCPSPVVVNRDDPRLARVFHEHPGLDGWRTWRLAETPAAYLLTAAGLWRQLFVVVDKNSLEVLRIATKNRLITQWSDLRSEEYAEVLQ